MVPKSVFAGIVCAALLAGSSASMADGYRPDEFLGLDLSKAALSPKLLGPPAQFAPFRVEAKANSRRRHVHARPAPKAAPRIAVAHVRVEKHYGSAPTRLVR